MAKLHSFQQTYRRIKFYSIILLLQISLTNCYPSNKWNFDPAKWNYLIENSEIVKCKDIYTFDRELTDNSRAQKFHRFRPTEKQDFPEWYPRERTCTSFLRSYATANLVAKNWAIYDVLSVHNGGTCGENNIRLRFRVWLDYIAYGCPCLEKSELHRMDIDVYVNKRTFTFSSFKWPTEEQPLETVYTNDEDPCDNCSL